MNVQSDAANRLTQGFLQVVLLGSMCSGKTTPNNPQTRRGITLVDTLGFNAGPKVEGVTKQVLDGADAVRVVLRANPPLTQTAVNLILSRVRGFASGEKAEKMFFVVFVSNVFFHSFIY